jgi:carboxypeptidase Q
MLKSILFLFLFVFGLNLSAQDKKEETAFFIKSIFENTMESGECYSWLQELCTQAGPRLSGSVSYDQAANLMAEKLKQIGCDTVWLQPTYVKKWTRGEKEEAKIIFGDKEKSSVPLRTLALGNSPGTPITGLRAQVIEVKSLDELDSIGNQVKGKIVFFNRPMPAGTLKSFRAYGATVDQRSRGAGVASKYGAIAVVVRSMTQNIDDVPHTGVTVFYPERGEKLIPAFAISTKGANLLSLLLKKESLRLFLKSNCQLDQDSTLAYNVIGEVRGIGKSNKIIAVGGHLDSWDVAQGAHDDGAGCVQSMQVLSTLKMLGYPPRNTIRCVLFSNEENGLAGAKAYKKWSDENGEQHIAAIEADAGGFTPRGFTCEGDTSIFRKYFKLVQAKMDYLEPYDLYLKPGGSGADIGILKSQKGILMGLSVDSQRYFDYHHTERDRFEAVHHRELRYGAAALTSMVYLLDGINWESP